MNQPQPNAAYKGFTIVELAITIVVIGILIGPLTATITDFYLDTIRSNTQTQMQTSLRAAMRSLSEDMKLSAGVQDLNLLADPHAPTGGWATSSSASQLVVKTPATDVADKFIFTPGGMPYYNEYVYYVDDHDLYKRVLRHPGAPGNTAVSTCPPSAPVTGCPADAKLVDDVGAMNFVLLDEMGVATTDPTIAQSITLTVQIEHPYGDRPIEVEENLTATFRNKRDV